MASEPHLTVIGNLTADPELRFRGGERRTVMELDVEEIGPSLRNATVKVTKAGRFVADDNDLRANAPEPNESPF